MKTLPVITSSCEGQHPILLEMSGALDVEALLDSTASGPPPTSDSHAIDRDDRHKSERNDRRDRDRHRDGSRDRTMT